MSVVDSPADDLGLDAAEVPDEFSSTKMRACIFCRLVKTVEQFYRNGCENCEEYLQLMKDRDRVQQCTTVKFSGVIAVMEEEPADGGSRQSWVARWEGLDQADRPKKSVAGCYALACTGKVSRQVWDDLEANGHHIPDEIKGED